MKRQHTVKKLYKENTKVVPFRCPESRVNDFKTKAYGILDSYAEEDSKLINQLQSEALDKSHKEALTSK